MSRQELDSLGSGEATAPGKRGPGTLEKGARNCLHLDGEGYCCCGNPPNLQITGTGSMAAFVRITLDTFKDSRGSTRDLANILAHGHDGVSEVFLRLNCRHLRLEAGSWQVKSLHGLRQSAPSHAMCIANHIAKITRHRLPFPL